MLGQVDYGGQKMPEVLKKLSKGNYETSAPIMNQIMPLCVSA